jgi:pimeloyl-ACP methyl ester carboxylesterase
VKLPTPLKIETPALFMASKKDSIIPYKYIDKVYKSYQGQKQLFELGCDHKDNRSSDVLARAIQWIMDVVGP